MSSKIFGTLTLIALAIPCFIGLKNKPPYQNEIAARQEIESKLEKTQARLTKAKKDLADTQAAHDEMKAEIPKVQAQKDDQEKANEALTSTKTAKTTEVEGNKAKLDQA